MADEREIGSFETCERCGRERGIVGDQCDADWSGTPTPDIYSDGERLACWHWARSDCEKLGRIRELEAERDRFFDKFCEKEEETHSVQMLMGGFEGQDATPSMVKALLGRVATAERQRDAAHESLCTDREASHVVIAGLRKKIAELEEERTAFVSAANVTAGTEGWAWTAALSRACGRISELEAQKPSIEVLEVISDALDLLGCEPEPDPKLAADFESAAKWTDLLMGPRG